MNKHTREPVARRTVAVPVPVPASSPGPGPASSADSATPPLPHERDEAVNMTGGVTSAVVQQGARDLKRGLEDTSRAPEADRAYKKLKK